MAKASARAGLEGDRAQLGPRLHLCLLDRRCRRCRHAPLRRSAHHRQREWPSGPPNRWRDRWPNPAPMCSIRPSVPVRVSSSWWSGQSSHRRRMCRCCRNVPSRPHGMVLDADTVRTILGMLQSPQIDHDSWLQDIVIEEDDDVHRHHLLGGTRRASRRTHRPGQAGHLRPHRGTARCRDPVRLERAAHSAHRRPGGRGAWLRMAAVRTGGVDPPGRSQRIRRVGIALQRSGVRRR